MRDCAARRDRIGVKVDGGLLGAKVGEPMTESTRGDDVAAYVEKLPFCFLCASSSMIEKPFDVEMRGAVANFEVSDGRSAVARGLQRA
jgi:hypothetical protein